MKKYDVFFTKYRKNELVHLIIKEFSSLFWIFQNEHGFIDENNVEAPNKRSFSVTRSQRYKRTALMPRSSSSSLSFVSVGPAAGIRRTIGEIKRSTSSRAKSYKH